MMRTQVLLKLAARPIKLLEFKLGTEKIQTQQIDKPLNVDVFRTAIFSVVACGHI